VGIFVSIESNIVRQSYKKEGFLGNDSSQRREAKFLGNSPRKKGIVRKKLTFVRCSQITLTIQAFKIKDLQVMLENEKVL
jgi:hypothetical protein